jgi:hypothetical protein
MRNTIYHVYARTSAQDPQYAKETNRPEDEGAAFDVYAPLFSTTDEDHAKFVCRSEDGRYMFTAEQGFYGELA